VKLAKSLSVKVKEKVQFMKIHSGVVSEQILNKFHNILGKSLMNNASNTCDIEQHISVASVLWPEIVEDEGHIFISEFYQGNLKSLQEQFNNDRRKIETWVNSWSISDFFLMSSNESMLDDEIVDEFAKILKFFWTLRVKELFPEREIIVELGIEIMGELGLTITVYQLKQ
jgi:hypothetical protein